MTPRFKVIVSDKDYCPEDHLEYGSEMLAQNAATLHTMINPGCGTIAVLSCKDHYHICHPLRRERKRCHEGEYKYVSSTNQV